LELDEIEQEFVIGKFRAGVGVGIWRRSWSFTIGAGFGVT
jgi:hypothetical protein